MALGGLVAWYRQPTAGYSKLISPPRDTSSVGYLLPLFGVAVRGRSESRCLRAIADSGYPGRLRILDPSRSQSAASFSD